MKNPKKQSLCTNKFTEWSNQEKNDVVAYDIWIIPRVAVGIEVVEVMGVGGKPASEDEYIPNICS